MTEPLWHHHHDGKEYPVTAKQTEEMFTLLFDEVLIAGNPQLTVFLMDMMQAFRDGKNLKEAMGTVESRHPWLKTLLQETENA